MKSIINLLITFSLLILITNCTGIEFAQIPPQILEIPTQQTPQISTPPIQTTRREGKSYYFKNFKLPSIIKETSGLIKVDNRLWTFNDSGGEAKLYQVDEANGHIIKTIQILNATNKDWEDIAYDEKYIYIGDIGNNAGNRQDLKIYKIPRIALKTQQQVKAEIIYFKYSDQRSFKTQIHKNNYDCEAMIAHNGKIYLFSKNWTNKKTRLYVLSNKAGKHIAKYISTFNVQGFVTGATINKKTNMFLLTTYSSLLSVNVWAFANYHGDNLFNGQAQHLRFTSPLQAQVEGITFLNNDKVYLSSEHFQKNIFSLDSALYTLDFSKEFE